MSGRRHFLGLSISALIGGLGALFAGPRRARSGFLLRPPGARPESDFLDACVRCMRCADACPNGCIRFHGLSEGLEKALTPYIHARSRGCIVCGKCAEACPTGALKPFETSPEGLLAGVKMGTARLNKSLCFSYNGRTCGACYRACPLPGTAMKIGLYEKPLLQEADQCIGCGLCEQACLHLPQAIRVVPVSETVG
ncbi:MAG: 4Fe-4S dicluster domain-containing protein [bacterium]|nr:ferredoxin [Deltaproteobacteria bacterium]MCP4903588.1 4Fe-4S dicluster domain-containing protein [bacterium]